MSNLSGESMQNFWVRIVKNWQGHSGHVILAQVNWLYLKNQGVMQENNLGVGRDERYELGSAGGSGGAVSRPSGGVLG